MIYLYLYLVRGQAERDPDDHLGALKSYRVITL